MSETAVNTTDADDHAERGSSTPLWRRWWVVLGVVIIAGLVLSSFVDTGLLDSIEHTARLPFSLARARAGRSIAANIAMMAIATSSSMRKKCAGSCRSKYGDNHDPTPMANR